MAAFLSRSSALATEGAAQDLVARLPALLLEAKRVAATVAQGTHGRRKAGPGETFWQFRNFGVGDSSTLIDWRRSAGSSHLFVREREWEAAHTVWIWADLSPSMYFRSHLAQHSKAERALVLGLALAALLTEAGERVGLPGHMEPKASRNVTSTMMEVFARAFADFSGFPNPELRLSRHSELIVFSDLLEAEDRLAEAFRRFARQGVRGHLVQILDPAEETLPYHGRVEFYDEERGTRFMAERAEALREGYTRRLTAHKAAIATAAVEVGWTPFIHHTDRSAVEVLLSIHMHLSGLEKAYRSKGMIGGNLGTRSDLT